MVAILTKWKMALASLLCLTLVVTTSPEGVVWSQTAPSKNTSSYSGQGVPLTSEEINSLVSPIALYPDALVAQILSAATFPDQVAIADNWLQQNKSLTGSALAQAVDKQSWDPSVKALTQFPTVLDNLAHSLAWTSQLGEAYHNQQSDVMSAIQTLRKQAQAAGNLKTTPQQTVSTQTQGGEQTIIIQPVNPQVIYVPTYNPTVVYGTPYSPPGYSTADLVTTGLLSFGAGIAVGAMMSGGCCGWGWSSWNCNWHGGAVVYHGGSYYGNAAWHGGYYGGYNNNGFRSNYNNGYQHYGNNNFSRNTNVSGNTVNFNQAHTNSLDKSGWANSDAAHGWGSSNSGKNSTAFSGWGSHSGSDFGSGGWANRSASSRGWGSRGGGGGWGGGGFRGGGFRR
jgi:Protein of unknown function (DUF3300)